MLKRFLFIVIFFSSQTIFAQNKKVITHEDMWLMKRVGAPEISPDGKWIVFSVLDPVYDEKEQNNDLWLAAADGSSKPRKLTGTKTGESNYSWSPDSKQVAFTAKRENDEVAQLYIISITEGGGEAQRITNLSTAVASPKWNNDGSMLLFTSKVYHGAFADSTNKKIAEEKKKIKYKVREYEHFPIRDWDKWIDETETHLFTIKPEAGATAKDLFATTDILNSNGFKFGSACWSANGKEIIFTATIELYTSAFKEPAFNIYSVAINDGNVKSLVADGFEYSDVAASKDGKYIYCQATVINNYKVFNLARLTRFNFPSMSGKTVLASRMDRGINKYALNGNDILMSVEYEGNDRLFKINIGETEATDITKNTTGCYSNISVSDNGVVVANYETSSMPAEAVKMNGTTHQQLSNFNTEKLATLDLQPIETFWFTASTKQRIRNIVVRPAGFDAAKKYPLFVLIHGGPASAFKDSWGYRWNYQLLAAPGYVLVLPEYTGATGNGEKFSQDIQFDPFKGPGIEINEAADQAIKKYTFIDATKQAAGGASYGGHLTNWIQGTTTRYKCLISHAGLMNSESQWGTSDAIYNREVMNGGTPWMNTKSFKEQNPIRFVSKFKTPVLITVGEQDFRVPLNNSIENFHVMQRMQIPSKLVVFPEENHWILKAENSRFFYKEVHNWLAKYLK